MVVIAVPKESGGAVKSGTRVAMTPEAARKLVKKGFAIWIERGAGDLAGFPESEYSGIQGVEIKDSAEVWKGDVLVRFQRPSRDEIGKMKKGATWISYLEPYLNDGIFEAFAQAGVQALSMELIPRTSRAQSMDALSSQANIAGYRAVLEAATRFPRFFPLMMTSAGSAKPAKVLVLGAGVAGLQAIATAKRLGAMVEAYDVRPEVKEQILSLGAKCVELDVGESGTGQGGYARELSDEAKKKQQALLTEKLKKSDIIISTANVPGRKAPILITREAVEGMRPGSVVIDMAAPSGGNCEVTQANQVITHRGVTVVGLSNYPDLMPADSSNFYAHNLIALLGILTTGSGADLKMQFDLKDDIVAAALVTDQGQVRFKRSG